MAYKTVAQLKESISGLLPGINLDNVVNLNGALERSARELKSLIYIPESTVQTAINLYSGVVDYVAPTEPDIFGSAVVDFRPQGMSRSPVEYSLKKPVDVFDRTKLILPSGYHLVFEYVNGVGRIRVASSRPTSKIELDPQTETTGWTAAGSASGLAQDENIYWDSPSSLRFTLTGSSTGTLTKAVTQVDIDKYEDVGVAFLAIRTPSISNLTNIALRVGSSASAYDEVTETDGFLGAWVVDQWLLVAFDFSGSTSTGTPDWNAIDYVQIRIAHTGTITNFRVGGLWLALASPHTILYQTAAFFKASGGTVSRTITSQNDSVVLTDDALVIYEYLAAKNVALQQGGTLASGLIQTFDAKLDGDPKAGKPGLIDIYRGNNPSQELRTVGNWYDD